MRAGMTAVVAKLDAAPDAAPAALLKTAGMTLVSTVGGASGPLYGTLFLRMGTSSGGPRGARRRRVRRRAAGRSRRVSSLAGRPARRQDDGGRADPAVDALDAALADGAGLSDALRAAATAADQGSDATIPLVARKGRASYLGERSAGHRDPGATSTALLVNTAAASLG
jgi:dihydroxyacetone kinase-like protein